MYRLFSLEQAKQAILERHGSTVCIVDETYVGMSKFAKFIDEEFGEWKALPWAVINGSGHIKRGHKKTNEALRLSLENVSERVRQQWNGVAMLDESTYVGYLELARFIDCDYGEWWARPSHVLRGTGRHPKRARANTVASRKVSVDDVLRRVKEKHNDQVLMVVETYVNTHTKATFVDNVYGEWIAMPYAVLAGRSHPARSLKKAVAAMRSYKPVLHWKTNEVCYSSSGYEHAVLVWLNKNRYDFEWQIPFQTPLLTQKLKRFAKYNVDLYIKDGKFANIYVEIKGTWSRRIGDGGLAKWEWFHATHTNSILWMRSDLLALGIIDMMDAYLKKAKYENG